MPQYYLLLFYLIFFIITVIYIWRKNLAFGGYYVFLFLYSYFSFAGYIFVPELSELMNAYFGEEVILIAIPFTILSLLVYLILFTAFNRSLEKIKLIKLIVNESNKNSYGWIILLILHLSYLAGYFVANFGQLDYHSINDSSNLELKNIYWTIWGMFFKWCVPIISCLYCIYRFEPKHSKNKSLKYIIYFELSLFIAICIKISNKTDLLALGLAIFFSELHSNRINPNNQLFSFRRVLATLVVFGTIISISSQARLNEAVTTEREEINYANILARDYYPPAHVMLAEIYYNIVDPVEVLLSNISNSLFFFNYPFLQFTVTEIFNPGVTDRSSSYAYYILGEGYMVMGFMGFIYNGLVLFIGISFWRIFGQSGNKSLNILITALIASQFANFSRGQSSYFIKHFIIFLVPSLFLYAYITKSKIKLNFRF